MSFAEVLNKTTIPTGPGKFSEVDKATILAENSFQGEAAVKKIMSSSTPFHTFRRLKRFAVETVAVIVAVIGGGVAFFLVFAWPTFTSRHQGLMLAWGWIGWIPGGLIGYYVAGVLRRLIRRILLTSAASTADRLHGLIWLLAIGVAMVLLVGYGDVNIQWQEEVRMADGEILLTNRTAQGQKQGEPGGPGGWNQTEMTLEIIKLPEGWKKPPIWRKEYVPILISQDRYQVE